MIGGWLHLLTETTPVVDPLYDPLPVVAVCLLVLGDAHLVGGPGVAPHGRQSHRQPDTRSEVEDQQDYSHLQIWHWVFTQSAILSLNTFSGETFSLSNSPLSPDILSETSLLFLRGFLAGGSSGFVSDFSILLLLRVEKGSLGCFISAPVFTLRVANPI